ncbi:MAG: RNA polymerase sigma factor [Bacteroidales bacterium]|nr:RNA polymerase sigma factor [Candidatus Cryptobacteroides caccocaballi]
MTDKEIIALYRSGEKDRAFASLVESYGERLYWHLRRFTNSHEDADDLLQECFMKIWTSLPDFREESRLYTWAYRIATNEALNHLRKNRWLAALQRENLDAVMEQRIDDDPSFDGNELQRELMKAINRLPAKQKLVFNLRYFDELSYEDIAEITGTSVGALKASYHFAYNKIKEELEKKF